MEETVNYVFFPHRGGAWSPHRAQRARPSTIRARYGSVKRVNPQYTGLYPDRDSLLCC